MTPLDSERVLFLELVRHWHTGHPRPDQVNHCVNVMTWTDQALDREPQPVAARQSIALAALGHDLYEDSKIDRALMVAEYGTEVDRLIEAVTEREDGVAEFVERVATGPEQARFIKLADGIDNYGGLITNGLLRANPAKWVEVVRKQMEPMFGRLAPLPFRVFPKAGEWLAAQLHTQRERFWSEVGVILGGRSSKSEQVAAGSG